MRAALSVLGVLAALVMIAVSGSMNFLFMKSMGKTELEGNVLGAASAAADVLKALLPFFIAWGWQATPRRAVFCAVGVAVFGFITAFSLLSALGFAADNRGHHAGTREGLNATYETVTRDLKEAERKRGQVPKHRPAAVVEQAINAMKLDRRWQGTSQCENATAQSSRDFCGEYFAARAELAAAIEDQRLALAVANYSREADRLRGQGAGQDKDPQVSIVSRLFKLDENLVRNALVIFAALLVEIGSGRGLFLATGHSESLRRGARDHPQSPMNQAQVSPLQSSAPPAPASPAVVMSPASPARLGRVEDQPQRRTVVESRPVGDIEEYWCACIEPASQGGLRLPELFDHYNRWCARENFEPAKQGVFASECERIAEAMEIAKSGPTYLGIRLGADQLSLTG